MENNKHFGLEIFLAVLGVGLIAYAIYYVGIEEKIQTEIDDMPKITQAKENNTTENFPSSIPLNAKTEIIQSYNATYPGSSVTQETTEFISSKSAQENYDFYSKWARDNSWTITNSKKGDAAYSLYIKRPGEEMNITIKSDKVIISYVDLQ